MNIHTTKDGDTMFISQMDDSHLQNTINLILRKIKTSIDMISGGITNNIDMIISGYDEERIISSAKSEIKKQYERLGQYCLEGVIRGFDLSDIQEVFGRKEKTKGAMIGKFYLTNKYEYEDDHVGEFEH